jgi:hypothetical protein
LPNYAGGLIDKNNLIQRKFDGALIKAGLIKRDKETKKVLNNQSLYGQPVYLSSERKS